MQATLITVTKTVNVEGMEIREGSRVIVIPPDAVGDLMTMEIATVLGRGEVEEALMDYKNNPEVDSFELCGRLTESLY